MISDKLKELKVDLENEKLRNWVYEDFETCSKNDGVDFKHGVFGIAGTMITQLIKTSIKMNSSETPLTNTLTRPQRRLKL